MRVAFFANQFAQARGHGIARFTHNLFESVKQVPGAPKLVPVATWSEKSAESLTQLKTQTGLQILPWGRKLTPLLWSQIKFPPLEWGVKGAIDVVHSQSLGYAVATRKPYLITIHDIGPLSHPQFFTDKPSWILRKSLDRAVKQARVFICVSNTTAEALVQYVKTHYQQDISKKIRVILEGVSARFFEAPAAHSLEGLALPDAPFILAAGAISPRKNLARVIKALELIKNKTQHHLIVVGGAGWEMDEVRFLVKKYQLQRRIHFMGYVTDNQLRALYRRADLFVYPSLFEGFGLTILEAMASQCPVITSNISCLPEIAGEAALLIDPYKEKDLAEGMLEILRNRTLRTTLKAKGLERAKQFTWQQCAQETVEVYNSLNL
jgi:glycosyltransferase involved in cell wall biosynthesis